MNVTFSFTEFKIRFTGGSSQQICHIHLWLVSLSPLVSLPPFLCHFVKHVLNIIDIILPPRVCCGPSHIISRSQLIITSINVGSILFTAPAERSPLHIHLRNLAQLIIMDYILIERGIRSALPCKQKTGLEWNLPPLNDSIGCSHLRRKDPLYRMICTEQSHWGLK